VDRCTGHGLDAVGVDEGGSVSLLDGKARIVRDERARHTDLLRTVRERLDLEALGERRAGLDAAERSKMKSSANTSTDEPRSITGLPPAPWAGAAAVAAAPMARAVTSARDISAIR
jgi:hypothetical protein